MSFDNSFSSKEPELRTVRVADIVEFPTELGNRCLLLHELGLNAYLNTEEELFSALTESARHSEYLNICLQHSRCRAFWNMFKKGITPFNERDPIRLIEHGGRYWVIEGKHRVCLAKRAGVESLEAYIWPLQEDMESLLSPEGNPGHFQFHYSLTLGNRQQAQGEAAILWVSSPHGIPLTRFDFSPVLLDARQDTEEKLITLFPGLIYRVSVTIMTKRLGIFQRRELLSVKSEVFIEPNHKKTKIWLLKVPAEEALSLRPAGLLPLTTVYRFGCWRQHHLNRLSRTCFGAF
ncbi:hypothetical protein [Thermoanaerobacterium sp. DL9XJH110]|uniref:hypothetical protein n=1 Tax=Thermoanaerobacterium sp. DL9XJH110 TaxID=3386643 RepID=UPI003BB59B58